MHLIMLDARSGRDPTYSTFGDYQNDNDDDWNHDTYDDDRHMWMMMSMKTHAIKSHAHIFSRSMQGGKQ